jgi:hypothetical protein
LTGWQTGTGTAVTGWQTSTGLQALGNETPAEPATARLSTAAPTAKATRIFFRRIAFSFPIRD